MNFVCSSVEKNDTYGLNQHVVGDYFIYIDNGWVQKDGYFFKGHKADWCKIHYGQDIKIETNKLRNFPIYSDDLSVTNIQKIGESIPVDGRVTLTGDKVIVDYIDKFYPKIPNDQLSFKDCKDILYDALIENVGTFVSNNNKDIMLPAQNGIDTLLVRSAFDYLGVEYQLFALEQKPNLSVLGKHLSKHFWGFNQIPEFSGKVLVSGFYGDEWILRNPYYVHVLLSTRGMSLVEKFDAMKECYMKKYFELYRDKCTHPQSKSREKLLTEICNDFQIWHLNDTTLLSPLKHETLLNLLAADNDTIISQVTDAQLSKAVIQMLNPALLDNLDTEKNQYDPDFFPST